MRQPGEASIQWKGTDVCMDVDCLCGGYFHIDGMFAYYVQCPHCGRIYQQPETLRLTVVEPGMAQMPPLMGFDI